jgi:hypothetical protein
MFPSLRSCPSKQGLPVSVLPPKVETVRAKEIARVELVKGLTLERQYHLASDSKKLLPPKHVKLLKPKKKDIDILDVRPVKLPLLTGTYRFRNYSYIRACVASTGGFVLDQTGKCLLCSNRPIAVCGNCGAIVCESHMRTCSVCSMSICTSCVVSKGILSKTHYCPEHKPRQ